jgi:pimeloyl-ACP methyl ester carboxylesterase
MTAPIDYAFLHGGGQGSWVWDATIAALAAQSGGGRALALDIPGCGTKRGRQTDQLTLDEVAAELIADLERSGMRDIVLVGHSQAGTVLPALLRRRPDLFRKLIYVSCCAPLPGQTIMQMIGTSRHGERDDEVGWPGDPTGAPGALYSQMFCNDMEAGEAKAFLERLGQDVWPPQAYAATDWSYEGLDAAPAAFVVCLRDGILPPPWQERFAERLNAKRLARIDAGHQVMNSRPHALAEILRLEAEGSLA